MRYASNIASNEKFYKEHYVEMINEVVNKHLFALSGKHKKLCWILTAMCGGLKKQFHPWIKPMKRTSNKSIQRLEKLFPTAKLSDLEVLDSVITDKELEDLEKDHGLD